MDEKLIQEFYKYKRKPLLYLGFIYMPTGYDLIENKIHGWKWNALNSEDIDIKHLTLTEFMTIIKTNSNLEIVELLYGRN